MSTPTPIDPQLSLLVACARGGVIGRDNQLPWRLPEDLKHFRATTLGHVLIMGRRTFDSIGRPLPGRKTIVLSRSPHWQAEGCLHASSLSQAIALAHQQGMGEVFVVGGEQVYRQALPQASRVLLTDIDLDVSGGDAHFPVLAPEHWRLVSKTDQVAASGLRFAIVDYRRQG